MYKKRGCLIADSPFFYFLETFEKILVSIYLPLLSDGRV